MMLPLQLIERRMQVDRAAIRRYADITQDYNPIHLDLAFAQQTAMGGIIAHGMLSLSLVWQSLQQTFGSRSMAGLAMDIRFVRPVRENDWVIAGGRRAEHATTFEVWVRAEGGGRSEIVISGAVTLDAASETEPNHIDPTLTDTRQGNPP